MRIIHLGLYCMYVCLSVRTCNSKTIAPIDLIFMIPVPRSSSKIVKIAITDLLMIV